MGSNVGRSWISFEAMRKAAGIVKDYVFELYYPLHHASWTDIARSLPLLMLVEYMVYQVDRISENAKGVDLHRAEGADYESLARYKAKFIALLTRLDAYDARVEHEIESGEQYVLLENKVTASPTIDHAEVMRVAELRPSDVRLLHCLLLGRLRGRSNEELLDIVWPVEVIADIGNDFRHYHEDVVRGSYNTYDMFVKLYGTRAPERVRLEIAKYEQIFIERLARVPVNRRARVAELCKKLYQAHTRVVPSPVLPDEVAPGRSVGPG